MREYRREVFERARLTNGGEFWRQARCSRGGLAAVASKQRECHGCGAVAISTCAWHACHRHASVAALALHLSCASHRPWHSVCGRATREERSASHGRTRAVGLVWGLVTCGSFICLFAFAPVPASPCPLSRTRLTICILAVQAPDNGEARNAGGEGECGSIFAWIFLMCAAPHASLETFWIATHTSFGWVWWMPGERLSRYMPVVRE